MTDTAELIARLREACNGAGRTNALIDDRNSARNALGGKDE